MRRRHWADLACVSALALALNAPAAFAEGPGVIDPTLGIPLPEQPALLLLDDEKPSTNPAATAPAEPDSAAPPDAQTATLPQAEPGMVTGAVTPSARPETTLMAPEPQLAPVAVPDEPVTLDIPQIDLPPADPALVAPQAAPVLRSAEPAIAPPDLPKVVVDLPAASSDLAAQILARAPEALALPRLGERERAEILAAYEANGHKPLWIDGKGWSAAGLRLTEKLGRAGEDGLRPGDYPLPAFEASDKGSLAEADVRLSALAVLYARDARGARVDPRRLSKLLTPTLSLPSATEVLSELAGAADAGAVLAAYNPPHEGYRRLKAKLAELREHQDDTPLVRIPSGPALKLGMRDDRVPLVRARLGLGPTEEPVFDRSTATALATFQKQAGLPATGILGAQTLAALGTPATARGEQDIVAQMERWRWLPADLGTDHIMVNVPEFRVRVIRQDKIVHETRAIVGKPETATPIFSHKMDHVIVNPSWYVPPSILRKEFLPGLAADPEYAAKRGYVVTRGKGGISVRQPPGERNALGWIKFMFPNDHAVYLHDTPNRRLFANEKRAFSHGCVRVDNPFLLADQVLGPEWTQERLKRLIGSGERRINLPQPLAIHLVYNTHVVGADGALTTFEDLYGFHRLVRQALEQRG
ncbi:L,D-transpeptidase family protein [Bosea sp. (in: a-proteobacteria)]|uniref:L,D-transpeptidase family protein n=1 Tax=Bosea sp. (in: a-proteobacteria) TaxID=1871050 RepID=UPI0027323300|nr:L,D-transpeptidase family protein [Bosea sp. (in: a-proteobacteria)]MDP3408693.1 L,D-transpeptidase family protein [Bosea sp. (in: a-proteobacteria)]